ncbi:uroporphyrinogen-III synthase [Deinococcus gobiensis]|uniref:Uroporphyrinogen III synthase HEM4 n=1 Tax=Deinococcus gobiensis (strain DSM 21396 / JCM 16679 / CGMCC 1.7299 / I-0) TaxID=745776 RepID=H8H0P9_DEIGI|nr:uroporphyrinogen-III synthase [Deinococcus gobiensis]AFD26918.1 Uroporphyrinogen III synthase HEM4 [Deinococcus gobiensis I-0]
MDWFAGLRVLSLESRRAPEMATLIEKYQGVPMVAPSLAEQKLDLGGVLDRFEAELEAGRVDAVAFMTGGGTRLFLRDLAARDPRHLETLRGLHLVARGTKPMQALKTFGLGAVSVPRPHTWREVQAHLLDTLKPGQHAVMLEYGEAAPPAMLRELEAAGLRVTSVPVYRCIFPEDTAPLARAVEATAAGDLDVLLLSSGTQVLNFLTYAESLGQLGAVRAGLRRMVVASIGPACSEAAGELGVRIDLEANPHKMGILVRTAAEHAPGLRERAWPRQAG